MKSPPKNLIALTPHIITTISLSMGVFAVVASIEQRWSAAVLAIVIGAVLDGLDGRIARLTHTESDFGVEFDSLSDVIVFGIAPAILFFQFSTVTLGRIGLATSVIYTAAAAVRLARFNVTSTNDKRYFIGLPSPPAAIAAASYVWLLATAEAAGTEAPWTFVSVALMISLGIAMISPVTYRSFKDLHLSTSTYIVGLLLGTFFIISIFDYWYIALFAVAMTYALSGPVGYFKNIIFKNEETPIMTKKTISTTAAPQAIGAYSQGVIVPAQSDLLFVSGQIPIDPSSGEVVADKEAQVAQVFDNLSAICSAAGAGLDDIAKLNVYLADLSLFGQVNDAMAQRFSQPYPARAVVEVSRLPKDVLIEVEAIIALGQ